VEWAWRILVANNPSAHKTPGEKPNARVYIVRHGNTDLNSGGSEPEKFRAWGDPPLNEKGFQSAHEAGAFLADKGIGHIFATDLTRTQQTAQVLHAHTGAPVTPVHGLRPWNLGNFTGQDVKQNEKEVETYQKNPDQVIPGGESYNTFLHRWNTTLQTMIKYSEHNQQPIALVTHTRNLNALKVAVSGKKNTPIHSMTSPGGIVRLDMLGGKIHLKDESMAEGVPDEHKNFQE
jgi:2,3-bisphosphoglycerate-dependent phosphoglycerate mutase